MSHMKVYSHGSIPFSWEDSPGVRKPQTPRHEQGSIVSGTSGDAFSHKYSPIPPPPPRVAGTRRMTISGMGICRRKEAAEEDPFLRAYKECTRDVPTATKLPGHSKKPKPKAGLRKNAWYILTCRRSVDVVEESIARLSHLPSLPRDRMNA
ncbi:hypothetical protein SAY87_006561 [Trapa incisa]|uniref:Uncharacterized protein n=2 Tax=Trapa TaxID=22665 RepID=A0AAN7L2L4_TRANT|nr:hypothetical protein SAY87_006561 [Trapa incisa]KAK4774998.1 hypothetical protein SAY86_009933 [Trapa natans]